MNPKQTAYESALRAALKAGVSPRAIQRLTRAGTDVVRAVTELRALAKAKAKPPKGKKTEDEADDFLDSDEGEIADDDLEDEDAEDEALPPAPEYMPDKDHPEDNKGKRKNKKKSQAARIAEQSACMAIYRRGALAAGVTLEKFIGAASPLQRREKASSQAHSTKQAKVFLAQMDEAGRINAGLSAKKRA